MHIPTMSPYSERPRWQVTRHVAVALLIAASLVAPPSAPAQTENVTTKVGPAGASYQTPYIRYREFQSAVLRSPISSVPLQKILTVRSEENIIDLFGEPRSTDRTRFGDDDEAVTLQYEGGTMFEYRTYGKEKFALLKFQLRRPPWSLAIGGTSLRQGLSIDSLSSAVRQSIENETYLTDAEIDGIVTIDIAKPNSVENGGPVLIQDGKAQVTVHVNAEDGEVKIVEFTRLGPWE